MSLTNTRNQGWRCRLFAAFGASSLLGATEPPSVPAGVAAFVDWRCLVCHDSATREAGLDLEALGFRLDDCNTFAQGANVFDRVERREMSPKRRAQPVEVERRPFIASLRPRLVVADRAQQAADRRTFPRRLNCYEYETTLGDQLQAPSPQLKDALPEDGEAHLFNKVSAVLDMSHVQLGRYLSTAEAALRGVMVPQVDRPETRTVHYYARDQTDFVRYINRFGGRRRVLLVLGSKLKTELMARDAPRPPTADPDVLGNEVMAVAIST